MLSCVQDNGTLTRQKMEVQTRLRELRNARGIAAAKLAGIVGVSRQTIYAIEDGSYVPNTAVALRLARVLEVRVEDLFALAELSSETEVNVTAELLSDESQFVRLCDVHRRLMAAPAAPVPVYLPFADGVVRSLSGRSASVRLAAMPESGRQILLAGCDPALSLLAKTLAPTGFEIINAPAPSRRALQWLKEGKVHVAGAHLRDRRSGEYNIPIIQRLFPDGAVRVITFAAWEEGLVFRSSNPKSIRSIADLARRDLRIVNREKGSGSRDLLDSGLAAAGIASAAVQGYDDIAQGHLAAALQVSTGTADCCIATRSAARCFGLGFHPLSAERFDLAIASASLQLPAIEGLIDALNRSALRKQLHTIAGYDTSETGKILV